MISGNTKDPGEDDKQIAEQSSPKTKDAGWIQWLHTVHSAISLIKISHQL